MFFFNFDMMKFAGMRFGTFHEIDFPSDFPCSNSSTVTYSNFRPYLHFQLVKFIRLYSSYLFYCSTVETIKSLLLMNSGHDFKLYSELFGGLTFLNLCY